MSTLTMTPQTDLAPPASSGSRHRDPIEGRVSTRGVVRAEWVKLLSVRSSTTALASAGAAMVAIGLIFAGILGGVLGGGEGPDDLTDPTAAALSGTVLTQLIIGVLGVLAITSEYTTGLIRTTLAAVPSRLPVLAAKAAVVTVATFPVMLASSLVAFLAGQALIGSGDLATASLGDPGVLRAVIGTAGYLTGVAVLGLAVGTLLRSTAAAISTLFAVVFLLPGLGSVLLPASWRDDVLQYLPSNAGTAFTNVTATPGLLSPGAGLAVFAAWVLIPLGLAAVALRRRAV